MGKVKCMQIGFTIILTLSLAIFTMGQKGCEMGDISEPEADVDEVSDTMEVEVGKTFTISLTSNPTTGYSWQPEFDSTFLELVDSRFAPGSSAVGSPGVESFDFLALRQGEVSLTMLYKRPWEDQPIDERVTTVSIVPTTVQASTVVQVAESMEQLLGQVVVLEGEFRGWDVGDDVLGTPVTASDWGIKDDTGTLYVTGSTDGLDPAPTSGDIGKPITLVALLSKQAESEIYFLRALEVHVQ